MSASAAYDRLAPHYRAYAETRSVYLAAVDRYIVRHAARAGRLLDVGAGDGVRAGALGVALGATRVVLCEPSARMAAACRTQSGATVWECGAQDMPQTEERFEVVTCLWNVLGHIADAPARLAALAHMRRLLAPQGLLFVDVNNRHNARAYGRARVLLRRCIDAVAPDIRRGDARFVWSIGGESIPVQGHLFTPHEMESLIRAAGLVVRERLAVDYATGAMSALPWRGQLLYRLSARQDGDESEATR